MGGLVAVLIDRPRRLLAQQPGLVNFVAGLGDLLLYDALFGAPPRAAALLVEHEGAACGFAVWYETFNTWTGKPGLYLEDLFIAEAARGLGAGKAIFQYLARVAVQRDCARLEFSVLDWNENAIKFYQSRGAQPLSEWTKYRITGEKLRALAAGDS